MIDAVNGSIELHSHKPDRIIIFHIHIYGILKYIWQLAKCLWHEDIDLFKIFMTLWHITTLAMISIDFSLSVVLKVIWVKINMTLWSYQCYLNFTNMLITQFSQWIIIWTTSTFSLHRQTSNEIIHSLEPRTWKIV